MSVRQDTIKVTRELRQAANDTADSETRSLVQAWARAWDGIVHEFQAAADEIAHAASLGRHVTIGQVRRMDRARNAVDAAERSIAKVLQQQERRIQPAVGDLVDVSARLNARAIATQMPPTEGSTAQLAPRFDRVNAEALDRIVQRSTERITSLSMPLSASANESMLRALVRSIPEGQSPRTAAARMVADTEDAFNGGLTRALTIARTEILDAYRYGAAAQQSANSDVVVGWVWTAELDTTTCPACVAEAGGEHGLDEFGPDDHPNGRCSRTPLVKPWSELGFDIPEPDSLIVSGPDWFGQQDDATQLAILGPGRLDALNSGQATWADMSTRRSNPGWRDSISPTPVADLVGAA